MNIYMGFSRGAGSNEGACLVFAKTAKLARKLAYKIVDCWFGGGWRDTAVKRLNADPDLFRLADQDMLKKNEAHAIENPESCHNCEMWGGMQSDGTCNLCDAVNE